MPTAAGTGITASELDAAAKAIEPKTIEWRRDFHAHPELSNREVRTAEQIAKHLRALGIEVKTGVGVTGVVGAAARRASPGRTVGLRADMDALPVTEQTDVPFKSKVDDAVSRRDRRRDARVRPRLRTSRSCSASPKCWRG